MGGGNKNSGFRDFPVIQSGENDLKCPITTDRLEVTDLSGLIPKGNEKFCNVMYFSLTVLYDHGEPMEIFGKHGSRGFLNRLTTFPEAVFITGENFGLYAPKGAPGKGEDWLPAGWQDASIIKARYPKINFGGGYIVVYPFEGIDVTRRFDLKMEWDAEKLVDILIKAHNDTGDYFGVNNVESSYFYDFMNTLSLKVTYLD